ncbi:PAS domain S-box protein [Desulfatirhabdium butyrativorans]|uniref:PAS domain S-box protein n=1 Tax=Desulfatirhabdium butyrativorans TaxID=340467 RepID=UPI0004022CE0|nr:PAS domain S-box protein [Desulfatirhabdium butyrativorans]
MQSEKLFIRLWVLLGILVVAILITGSWFYNHHNANMRQRVVDQLRSIAELKVEQISRWRSEQLADASTFLGTPFMIGATRMMALGQMEPELVEGIVSRLYNLKKHYQYQDVILANPDGEIVLCTSGCLAPLHAEALEAMKIAFHSNQPVLTDIHQMPDSLSSHFDCVVPFQIQEPDGRFVPAFAIILRIDTAIFLSPHLRSWPLPSQSAETLLVRKEGDVVRYLNELRFSGSKRLEITIPLDRNEVPAVQAANGKTGYTEGVDYRGRPVVAYIANVPKTSWILIAKIDREEVFEQMAFENRIIVVLICAGILAVLAGVGLLYHRMNERQFKSLYLAELAIKQSELQHKATLMSIGDGVIVTDPSGKVLMMNPVSETLTGWSLEEAKGQAVETVFPIVNEETRQCVENPVHRVCRDGCVVGLANHTVLLNREGREIPIADCGSPISGPDGNLQGAVLVFRDQSRERASEKAIREAHNLLRLVLDTVQVRVFWKDTEGHYLGCNMAFAKDNGLDGVEEVIGKTDRDFHIPEAAERFHAEDMEVIRSGKPKRFYEVFLTLPDGSAAWQLVSKSPLRDSEGNTQGILGTYQDITSIKKAEAEARNKARVDAVIAELSRHLLEPKADIPQVAPLVLERCLMLTQSMYGYVGSIHETSEELILDATRGPEPCMLGDVSSIHLMKKADGSYPGLWGHSLNTGATLVSENPAAHPSARGLPEGHVPLQRYLSVPILMENELIGQIGLANSPNAYSESTVAALERIAVLYGMFLRLKRIGSKLSEVEARLFQTQKMEAVGRLAGGVAHDFNNMIQVIQSYAELAKQKAATLDTGTTDTGLSRYMDRIEDAAEKSADLTRKLLAFARKQPIAPRRVNLNDTIENMLKMVRRLIGENIELLWKPGGHLDRIFIDPSQIDQILVNLSVNARDAIEGTGTITVETHNTELDAAYVRKHPFMSAGNYVVMSVADTGCGMDEKIKSMIFEPFFTTKPVGKGTGLGLSTVYGIVKQNNGHITVYSEPGKGTVFHIFFPSCPPDAETEETAKLKTIQRGTETILLVEDDPVLLEVAQQALENLGYTVLAASHPTEAIHICRTHEGIIDLLMTDMIMPEMNGRQLAQTIQQTRAGIPCLYMSGYTQDVFSADGKIDPDIHFIQKPFTIGVLSETIRKAIGKGAS